MKRHAHLACRILLTAVMLTSAEFSYAEEPHRLSEDEMHARAMASETSPKRRREAGFFEIPGAHIPVRGGLRHSGGKSISRGFSLAFTTTLPCGQSSGFTKQLKQTLCGKNRERDKNEKDREREAKKVFPKGKRGQIEVVRSRQIDMAVLEPPGIGLTVTDQPVLHWFLSKDWDGAVEFILTIPKQAEPVLRKSLSKPEGYTKGIHRMALADENIHLKLGVEYEWSVAIIGDPEQPEDDIVASGAIKYISTSAQTKKTQHDTIAETSRALEKNPQDSALHCRRAELIRRAELPAEVADYDRQQSGGKCADG
ncbi:MAG: DUF928 domain-containing protein [Gammaproteobacteria bacterium]|nr:DUF928 domain-containing protein [Gammaproteobacteria bacterium]